MADIKPVLEPAAQEFADSTASPPFLFDLPVEEGRKVVDSVQDGDIPAPAADVTDHLIPGGPLTEVSIKIYRPRGSSGTLPVLLYTHGAGWVFGDAHTHDRLVRELTRGAHVIATVRGDADEARRLGAEEVYDTQAVDLASALHAAHPRRRRCGPGSGQRPGRHPR